MERYLTAGSKIELKGIDGHYIIKDIIGRGSSCVVYTTEFFNPNGEKTEHLLKEFNPRCISLERVNGVLRPVKKEDIELFESLFKQFKDGFDKQAKLRTFPELKNYTANIQNTYYDNGTVYIDMTETNGKSYADVEEKSIFDLARRIKVLAQVIGNYHKRGYLHLDIKPSNIFVRPEDETCEDVKLFDFDSLVPFCEENGKCVIDKSVSVSYTTEYAPIELISASRRGRIGKATDIYEIGEIFFEKLMGRHSTALEHNTWFDYEYNISAPIFKNVNPKVKSLLDEFLGHTICNVAAERYQTTEELIEKLDEIIEIAGQKNYLLKNLPIKNNIFIGRQKEFSELNTLLKEYSKVFVNGIGGIGKSEFVKQYAYTFDKYYDTIVFTTFDSDIDSLIYSIPIANLSSPENSGIQRKEYIKIKYDILKRCCDKRTLIIIDNYNLDDIKPLSKMLELSCDIIITTRNDYTDENKPQISISSLCEEECFQLFKHYYQKVLLSPEESIVKEIIDLYRGHTLAVEFLAKQMRASCINPKEELERLKKEGFKGAGKEEIHSGKDDGLSGDNAYRLMHIVFDAAKLFADELKVMVNLALFPPSGIHKNKFKEWCELDSFNTVNRLEKSGWLNCDKETDYISLHPLIADIILEELEKDISLCETLLKHITELFIDGSFESYDSSVRSKLFDMNSTICDRIYRFCNLSEICIDFINATVMNFYLYGYINEYIDYMIKVIEASESFITFPKEKIAKYYNTLGMLYLYNDKFAEAQDCFNKSLGIKEQLYGRGHGEIAISLNDIGLLYYNQGKINVAKQYWEEALKIRKDVSDSSADVAQSYNNMGVIYANLENIAKAEVNYNNAKKIYLSLGEEKYSDSVITYVNLGNLYTKYETYDKAEKNLIRAYELSERIHGDKHYYTVKVLQHLGVLYSKNKKYENAEIYYKKALEISIELYGEYHSCTANIYNSIAVLYKKLNRIKEATNYYSKVRKIYLNVYGENHPSTASIYSNLGGLALACKDFKNAEILFSRAKNIWFDVYDGNKNHKNIATIYENIGVLFERQGDNEKAIEHFKEALNIKKRIFDIGHPDIKILEDKIKILKQN